MALGLFEWAVLGSEGIGLGIGTAAQGAQHAGTQVTGLSDSGEAGIGKLVLELGIPGLVLVTALFFFLGRRVWDLVRLLARYDQRLHIYAVSFLALLVANMVTFTVATQVYGDPFVLLVLGLVAGLLFSTLYVGLNRQAQDGASLRRLARAPVPREASSST
jgi:O-antigen ligase